MGMDAKVAIWAGVRFGDTGIGWGEFKEHLPEDLFEPDGCTILRPGAEDLQTFECSDSVVGFGIPVFEHDWDYGVVEFDTHDINARANHALSVFDTLMIQWGVIAALSPEIGV